MYPKDQTLVENDLKLQCFRNWQSGVIVSWDEHALVASGQVWCALCSSRDVCDTTSQRRVSFVYQKELCNFLIYELVTLGCSTPPGKKLDQKFYCHQIVAFFVETLTKVAIPIPARMANKTENKQGLYKKSFIFTLCYQKREWYKVLLWR